jgi:uncharacterized membrane protein
MAEKKIVVTTTSVPREQVLKAKSSTLPLFEKENYMWMIIGAVVVALGMLLMAGGKNQDANQFDYNLVYSKTRITVAPILILLGLMVEIYAIFKRPKTQHQ